jgi:ferrous iron transport protein B
VVEQTFFRQQIPRISHLDAMVTGFCIMLFCLISTPCVATVAMTKQETNSWAWALFQFFGLTALAYIVTFIVYQLGSLLAA